jgi:hypothetical protein
MTMRTKTPRRERRGVAAMEFAFWLPILFIMISGIVDWSFFMSLRVHVARATMDGCRAGAATFEPRTQPAGAVAVPNAVARIGDILDGVGVGTGGASISAQFCDLGDGGVCGTAPLQALYCRTNYPFTPFFGLVGTPGNIEADFIMAMESQRN